MALQLTIGEVLFDQFEIPERLPISWKQARAVNEFPGGTRTIYALGSFPKPMRWGGYLLGANAFARVAAMERLCAAGLSVEMDYGPFAWLGLVTDFIFNVEHQWKIGYMVEFEPSVDLSGIGVVPPLVSTAEQLLAFALSVYDAIEGGTETGIALPYQLGTAAAGVDTAVAAGLLDASGVVAAMSSGDVSGITTAVATVLEDAAPIIAGTDAVAASSALDLSSWAAKVGAIAALPNPVSRVLNGIVNPNLFALAAQYLGDAQAWQAIANASGISPPDPMPTGIFTIVVP